MILHHFKRQISWPNGLQFSEIHPACVFLFNILAQTREREIDRYREVKMLLHTSKSILILLLSPGLCMQSLVYAGCFHSGDQMDKHWWKALMGISGNSLLLSKSLRKRREKSIESFLGTISVRRFWFTRGSWKTTVRTKLNLTRIGPSPVWELKNV